ncbi:DJ-1 family glyoxalase III [Acidihalobacter ferrooxydans]|uniref:DJ-1 family protein n=1 Tax=Acidihalobacter ferrooxydans TaxID=1765967 RepID=A0A1P8UD71_9GAMM|nr:DJ-1 family glyoxalase III [Acidihalobacter ferrooxydans]APZ41743.1 DJ-1 family protein [Acidihalobacter ferrooxydans]
MPRVLIPLAAGSEELEAVTLIDLLRRGGVEVVVAGLEAGPVRCSRGTVIVPDTPLDAVLGQPFDMLVLPGGMPGANHLRDDDRLLDMLRRLVEGGGRAAAICAAPKALERAGLLAGRRFTAFPGAVADASGAAIESDGPIFTSRGPGTAMDFALHLLEQLTDRSNREQVEAALQRP